MFYFFDIKERWLETQEINSNLIDSPYYNQCLKLKNLQFIQSAESTATSADCFYICELHNRKSGERDCDGSTWKSGVEFDQSASPLRHCRKQQRDLHFFVLPPNITFSLTQNRRGQPIVDSRW